MAGIPRRALVVVIVLVSAVAVVLGAFQLTSLADADADADTESRTVPSPAGGSAALETGDELIEPLPLPDAGEPLIGSPVPESGFATGEFVEGFPEEALPLAPGSELTSSSLAVEGNRVQAGLIATSTGTAGDLLDFYRSVFTALQLTEREADAVPGSTALVFERDANAITLTMTERDGVVDYTLAGILVAE